MNTDRSRLEAGVHPLTDPRRDPELRAELEQYAQALTPMWRPSKDRDDFGHALLRIGARLAEQSTVRLDGSARRDALAFFDFLGLPPGPPRPATGVLVLVLDPKFVAPVHAPARTQVSVTTADDEQVTFETESRIRLIPGGIAELYSADPSTDRIERAPAQVTSAQPPTSWADNYRLVTFSGSGSSTVQLSPLAGLREQELLQIGQYVYRVKDEEDNGLVTLLDALEEPATAGQAATRVTQFRAFDLRNVQRHEFHVGHVELLNLKQPATITLDLSPQSLARELGALDIDFALFGTREPGEEPKWHPIDLLDVHGSRLRLAKAWSGTVEKTEVSGHKNRWLRARLRTPVNGRTSATTPAASLRLTVASAEADETESNGTPDVPGSPTDEGSSRTVLHAAHNGTPLATTGRFHPFGPEPVRFDTFALAAPEALSKKGATVTLAFGLSDSSMKSFGVSLQVPQNPPVKRWHGFGASHTGDLQVIFTENDRLQWFESAVIAQDGHRIFLGDMAPVAVELSMDESDVVVIEDRAGNFWGGVVRRGGSPTTVTIPENWHRLDGPDETARASRLTSVVAPAPHHMTNTAAVVIDVRDGGLHALWLGRDARPLGKWIAVDEGGGDAPVLTSPRQLTPIQGSAWPQQSDRLDLVARDANGQLWRGTLAASGTDELVATWTVLGRDVRSSVQPFPRARDDVVPAATWYRDKYGNERLWVVFAVEEKGPTTICGIDAVLQVDGTVKIADWVSPAEVSVAPGSVLHAHPRIRGINKRPAVAGVSTTEMQVFIWQGESEVRAMPVDAKISGTAPQLVLSTAGKNGDQAEILIPGHGERLFRGMFPQAKTFSYKLHDLVELESERVAHRAEVDPSSPGSGTVSAPTMVALDHKNRRIVDGNHRVYEVDSLRLSAGTEIRFLRLSEDSPFIGTFVTPGNHKTLTLDAKDTVSEKGFRLVIGDASYVIEELSAERVATLDHGVASVDVEDETCTYYVVTEESRSQFRSEHQRTLVELHVGETDETPENLAFGPPAKPGIQGFQRVGPDKDPLWVQLVRAWEAQPTNDSAAGTAAQPTWTTNVRPRDYGNPELSWEYFDGEAWQKLVTKFADGTANLSTTGNITFVVPPDLTTTEIGGKEAYWIRARLIGGDYGRPTYRVTSVEQGSITTQTVVVDTSELNPPEIVSVEASFSGPDPALPETVLVENNGGVLDQTQAAMVPTATFELFQGAAALGGPDDTGRALFAGLTGPVEAGAFTLFVDAEDQPGRGTVAVDVLTPDGWHRVAVDDGTASMRRTGLIHLSLDRTPIPLRLFGKDRIWLRFRAGDNPVGGAARDGAATAWAPVVRALLSNAVHVSHATTMGNEVLGSSVGEPATTVFLSAVPVLPDSVELRVREDLSGEESTTLEEQHRQQRGTSADARTKAFVRDLPGAPGTWVLWQRVDSLIGQDRDARVYVLEPTTGRVTFGDDRAGRIPPAGRDSIRCFSYQQGGGAVGNVPAWIKTKLTSAVAGVETAALPLGTAGGADSPPPDAVFATAPNQLRHAGRAVAPADVEDLVVASTGDILRARCLRPDVPGGPLRVSVVVRDRTTHRPQPTHAQRGAVVDYLREVGWGGLDQDTVAVAGPNYVPVEVAVQLIARPESWAEVEQAARERLVAFFDPEHGGPSGSGWPFGRRPTTTDLLRVLHGVHGIERIAEARVTGPGGAPMGEVPPDGMVCAEAAAITVTVSGEGNVS
jgi:hypothetical protein